MAMRFIVLASGSGGNASFIEADGVGMLIDVGLGPKQLATRLASVDLNWQQIKGVLLTHTHTDHWNERTLTQLAGWNIPFYCHPQHQRQLHSASLAFSELVARHLVRPYEIEETFNLAPRFSCLPFAVPHDRAMTCGFRFEGTTDLFGQPVALGYAADLGCWDKALAQTLANVDVLALEFNHDVTLQLASNRSRHTIARNLGNRGHLSNEQAAALVKEVLNLSTTDSLQHLVQLHLSQECNRPALAVGALRDVLTSVRFRIEVHTAEQDRAGPSLKIGNLVSPSRSGAKGRRIRQVGKKNNQARICVYSTLFARLGRVKKRPLSPEGRGAFPTVTLIRFVMKRPDSRPGIFRGFFHFVGCLVGCRFPDA